MPVHQWTVICSKALVDQFTNNVSLIDVVDEIRFQVDASVDLTKPLSTLPSNAPNVVPLVEQHFTIQYNDTGHTCESAAHAR
jgi:hypothetical protein